MRQKGFAPILIIILVLAAISGAYFYGLKRGNILPTANPPLPTVVSTVSPVPDSTPTTHPVENGVVIGGIRYELPQGWTAELRDGGLSISAPGGGYFFIKAYDYPSNTGRREYYCKVVKYCIDSTYFTEKRIGNISGYQASSLDNSGGGSDYFGSKGNKFYIINTYAPYSSTPNEFDSNRQSVLDSLKF